MFLLRLIHLSGIKSENEKIFTNKDIENKKESISSETIKKDTINQIKNVSQEKKQNLYHN